MNVIEDFVSAKATPEAVERHFTDMSLVNEWVSPIVLIEPLKGQWMDVGSTYAVRLKPLLLLNTTLYRVEEREQGRILLSFTGSWRGTNMWRWFVDGSQTIIHNRIDYEVINPALRVFVIGLGTPFFRLDMNIQMNNLRQVIEGRRLPEGNPASQATAE